MNMISTGAFLNEMDASNKQPSTAEKFAAVWEKKNAKAARAGGVSLMALSLAACGSSSTTTSTTTSTDSTSTTTTTVTPISSALTTAADDVDGTTGADTVTGARSDTIQTLNTADNIDLGAGADSLSATLNAGSIQPTLAGIETLTFSAVGAATVDFDDASGYTTLVNSGSTNTLTLDDVASIADMSIMNTGQATTVTYKTATLSGAADTMSLTLTDVTGGVITIGSEADADGDFETVNIVSNGTANTTGDIAFGADATTVTVTGAADLDIDAGAEFAKVASFDASAATGAVKVQFADRASTSTSFDVTATTGSGNDLVTITNWAAADFDNITVDLGAGDDTLVDTKATRDGDTGSSYAGGEGTDTLRIDGAMTAAEEALYSGFEILEFAAVADSEGAQDMDNTDGMSKVNVFSVAAATADLTLNDAMDDLVVSINGATIAATTNNAAESIAQRIVSGDANDGGEDMDTLTVNLKTDTASDALTLNIGGTPGGMSLETFAPSATYETVTVNSTGLLENSIETVSTALNNMTFTGATGISLHSTGSLTGVVDASAMTATFGAISSTTAITITGGSGADYLRTGAATAAQTLNGGAGDDTLIAGVIVGSADGAVAYAFNGGAGNDKLDLDAVDGSGGDSGDDIVITANGGAGTDLIQLGDSGGDSQNIHQTSAMTTADLDIVQGFEDGSGGASDVEDDIDYNGTILNDSTTTAATESTAATLALAISGNTAAGTFTVTTNLSGTASTALGSIADLTDQNAGNLQTLVDQLEAAVVTTLGTVSGLDAALASNEKVLLIMENGTDSAMFYVTNTDTSVSNTLTVDEIALIGVYDAHVLTGAEIV